MFRRFSGWVDVSREIRRLAGKELQNLDVLHFAMLFRHLRQTLHAFEKFQTLGIEADYIIHIFRWRKKHVHDSPGFSRGERFLHRARSDDASSDWVRGARSIFRLLLQEDPPLGAPFARRLGDSQQTPHQSTVKSVGTKMKHRCTKFQVLFWRRFFPYSFFNSCSKADFTGVLMGNFTWVLETQIGNVLRRVQGRAYR